MEEVYGVRGEQVRVIKQDSLHFGQVGWVTGTWESLIRVRFSSSQHDYGYYERWELVPARVPVQQAVASRSTAEAMHRIEIQRAAVGDCGPTQWNPDHLDVFLSLIGNCKEEG